MMEKRMLVLFVFLLGFQIAFAQRKIKQMDPQKEEMEAAAKQSQKVPLMDRLVFGGNFGLSFSNVSSQVLLAPLVGYKVNDNFMAGTGFTYIYWKQTYSYFPTPGSYTTNSISVSDNVFGLNFFARHNLFNPAFAHAEYQPMNFTSYNAYNQSKRVWTNAMYLGGGINQSGMYMMVLYDVLWQTPSSDPNSYSKSFYSSPWNIRFGFMF